VPEHARKLHEAVKQMRKAHNAFEALGVQPTAPRATVKQAYFQLVKVLHPDKRCEEAEAIVGGKELCDEMFRILQKSRDQAEGWYEKKERK